MAGNGEVKNLDTEGMPLEQKVDLLIEAIRDLIDTIEEEHEELVEKINNLNLETESYGGFNGD